MPCAARTTPLVTVTAAHLPTPLQLRFRHHIYIFIHLTTMPNRAPPEVVSLILNSAAADDDRHMFRYRLDNRMRNPNYDLLMVPLWTYQTLVSCAQVDQTWFEVATDLLWSKCINVLDRLGRILDESGVERCQMYASKVEQLALTRRSAGQIKLREVSVVFDKLRSLAAVYLITEQDARMFFTPALRSFRFKNGCLTAVMMRELGMQCANLKELRLSVIDQHLQASVQSLAFLFSRSSLTTLQINHGGDVPLMHHVDVVRALLSNPLEYLATTSISSASLKSVLPNTKLTTLRHILYTCSELESLELMLKHSPNVTTLNLQMRVDSEHVCQLISRCGCHKLMVLRLVKDMYMFGARYVPDTTLSCHDGEDLACLAESSPLITELCLYCPTRVRMYNVDLLVTKACNLSNLRELVINADDNSTDISFATLVNIGMACRRLVELDVTLSSSIELDLGLVPIDKILFPYLIKLRPMVSNTRNPHNDSQCIRDSFIAKHMPHIDRRQGEQLCISNCSYHSSLAAGE